MDMRVCVWGGVIYILLTDQEREITVFSETKYSATLIINSDHHSATPNVKV